MASKSELKMLASVIRYIFYASDVPLEELKKIAAQSLNKLVEMGIMTLARKTH